MVSPKEKDELEYNFSQDSQVMSKEDIARGSQNLELFNDNRVRIVYRQPQKQVKHPTLRGKNVDSESQSLETLKFDYTMQPKTFLNISCKQLTPGQPSKL